MNFFYQKNIIKYFNKLQLPETLSCDSDPAELPKETKVRNCNVRHFIPMQGINRHPLNVVPVVKG